MNILNILNKYTDSNYAQFQNKIISTKYPILGVKIPILKKIRNDLLKEFTYEDIINNLNNFYFEEVMLEGLIINKCFISFNERLKLIDKFIPKIDNWAICDVFCSDAKFVKENKEKFLKYIEKLLESKEEYSIRVGIVMLLNYYIENDYFNYVLEKLLTIKSDYYYVNMAISWAYSMCLVKDFSKTCQFMNDNKDKFNKDVFNKTLQKGKESLKICQENKIILQKVVLNIMTDNDIRYKQYLNQ